MYFLLSMYEVGMELCVVLKPGCSKLKCHNLHYIQLRQLTECLILIGSAMFDANFNLLTRVGLPQFLKHRKTGV